MTASMMHPVPLKGYYGRSRDLLGFLGNTYQKILHSGRFGDRQLCQLIQDHLYRHKAAVKICICTFPSSQLTHIWGQSRCTSAVLHGINDSPA